MAISYLLKSKCIFCEDISPSSLATTTSSTCISYHDTYINSVSSYNQKFHCLLIVIIIPNYSNLSVRVEYNIQGVIAQVISKLASCSALSLFQICPEMHGNEIPVHHNRHHKVSSLMKSHQNTQNYIKYEVYENV